MKFIGESGEFIRFSIVGVSVAAIYVLGYAGLTDLGFGKTTANAVSFLTAVIVQYFLQTIWTFKKPLAVQAQWQRFFAMVAFGFVYSAIITSTASQTGPIPAWVAASIVAITLPVLNYVVMRFWVYSR